jgi:predicted RND superfamily exporter protein
MIPRSRIDRRILRPMEYGLLRAQRSARRHAMIVVGLTAIVVCTVLPVVPRVSVALSIRDAVDPDSRAVSELQRCDAAFGDEYSFLLLVRPLDPARGFSPEQSRAIEDWVRAWQADSRVRHIESPLAIRRAVDAGDSLRLEPLLEDLTPASLERLRGTPWQGLLTDRDCRDVAVEISLTPRPGRFGRFDPRVVERIVADARLRLEEHTGGMSVHATGTGAFEAEAIRGIGRFRLLNLAVVGLLIGLTRMWLGTWRAGFLVLVPVLVASAVVYGGMYLRGDPIDMLSTGLFLLLAVAAIEDFYFLSHLRMRASSGWKSPFRRLVLPGMLTSLTTLLGFGSLLVSDLAIVRRLGLWAGCGATVEWAATFLVLPSLLQLVPPARNWTNPDRARGVRRLDRLAALRMRRTVGLGLLLVIALGAAGTFHLNYEDSPENTFPANNRYSVAQRELRTTRNWAGSFWVVSAARPDDPIDDYEAEWVALDDALRLFQDWPEVESVLDPASVVEDVTGGNRDWLTRLSSARDDQEDLDTGNFAGVDGSLRARVFLRDVDLATVSDLRDFIRGMGKERGIYPAGDLIAYSEFAGAVPRALLTSLLTCLLLVGVVVALVVRARGTKPVIGVLLASAWGPALVLAVISWTGVPVNFLTCVFAGVLVGLTGDNALQFVCAGPDRSIVAGASSRGAASIRIALVMTACSLVFLGSAFVASRRLGILLGLGLLGSLIGDLWILRSVLRERGAP